MINTINTKQRKEFKEMKKLFLTLFTASVLLLTTTASAVQSTGWRIIVTNSIANDTPILLSEIELLGEASYSVAGVTTGAGGSFDLSTSSVGDVTDQFPAGATFTVSDSTGNDGQYTVASSAYAGGQTTITVESTETVVSSTVDGTITTDDYVDASRGDLGQTLCGWTRQVPNLTGNTTPIPVGCDTVKVNQQPDSSISVPAGTSRIRLGNRLFDDDATTEFKTARRIDENNQFIIIYQFYQGSSAPTRVLADIKQVSMTVPIDYVGPGDDGLAPSIFSIEYQGSSGNWVRILDVEAANFNDGTDIDLGGTTDPEAKKLIFTID